VHIAARLLGHEDLSTTQAYLAVFQDDLIRSYRAFLDQRRAVRPEAEYREPTEDEWREFQHYFTLARLRSALAGAPTVCRADMSTAASAARCCRSIPANARDWSRPSPI
jgi:hypothetical protein